MKSFLTFLFFATTSCLPLTVSAQPTTTLLCDAKVQGQVLQKVLKVDYTKKTVNDAPGRFSDVEITWTTANVDNSAGHTTYLDHHLNRLSGVYYADSRGGNFIRTGPPASFSCRKAPAQMF